MKNAMEVQIRQVALVVSGLFLAQLLWSGTRLALLSDPEPIAPAASTLQSGGLLGEREAEAGGDFVARPLFWPGREAYQPSPDEPQVVEAPVEQRKPLKNIRLMGVYAAGPNSGIIVKHKDVQRRLQINESIDGWTFTMMSPSGAIFENEEESRILELEHVLPAQSRQRQRNSRTVERSQALRQTAEESDKSEQEEGGT